MTSTPCPRDHAALTTAFCPDCGLPYLDDAGMTTDERMALEIYNAGARAIAGIPLRSWEDTNRIAKPRALAELAKARELLARPLPSVEELAKVIKTDVNMQTTAFGAALDVLGFLTTLSAPPAQPELSSVPAAMRIVTRALRDDPGYRISWVANIAMAFKDHFGACPRPVNADDLHRIANEAAEAFVDLLCKDTPAQPEPAKADERRYPCAKCGKLRSVAEGGAVFTTCEGPGHNCDGAPEETPAPAPSAEPPEERAAWDAFIRFCHVLPMEHQARAGHEAKLLVDACTVRGNRLHIERDAALERAEKAERERDEVNIEVAKAELSHTRTKAQLEAGLREVLERDEVYPVAETAIRILREQKATIAALTAEVERARRETNGWKRAKEAACREVDRIIAQFDRAAETYAAAPETKGAK